MKKLAFRHLGSSELLPRYVFAEKLYARRRVLEVGAVSSTEGASAAFLLERGARSVVACDSNTQAIDEAQKKWASTHLHFRLDVWESFEPESFDFIAVADASMLVSNDQAFAALRRLLTQDGYVMAGLRNPAGLSLAQMLQPEHGETFITYGQLLEAWSPHFSSIEVALQMAVVGYQLHFESLDNLLIDRTLAQPSDAGYWVVLAGSEPALAVNPRWVQLPPEPLAFTKNRLSDVATRARDWQERAEKNKKALEISRNLGLEKDAELAQTKNDLEKARDSISRLTAKLESALHRPQQELDRDEWARRIRRYESEKEVANEQVALAQQRIADLESKLRALESDRQEARAASLAFAEEARLEKARRQELIQQVAESRERLVAAYQDVTRAQEESAATALEFEKIKLSMERSRVAQLDLERDLQAAKESELRLASKHSATLNELEKLQAALSTRTSSLQQAQDSLLTKEAEIERLARLAQTEAERAKLIRNEIEGERHQNAELRTALDAQTSLMASLETELAAAVSRGEHLEEQRKTWLSTEQRLTALSLDLEQRVANMTNELQEKQFLQDLMATQEAQFHHSRKDFEMRNATLRKDLEHSENLRRALQEDVESLKRALATEQVPITEEEVADLSFSMDETQPSGQEQTLPPSVLEDVKRRDKP